MSGGFPLISLRRWEGAGRFRHVRAPRLAYRTFKGDPGKLSPNHSCKNQNCFNPDHLFLGKFQGSRAHEIVKCQKCGEQRPREEMDEEQLRTRHYVCKIHTQEAEERRQAEKNKREEMRKEQERKRVERIEKLNSPDRKAILEERRIRENKKRVAHMKEKYKNDPAFYALVCCRRRINNLIGPSYRRPYRTLEMIGCSKEFFMHHIESQFTKQMNWNNKGKVWEFDHIRPCASFDLTGPEQQKQCFHYSNQRPLLKRHNREKSDTWDGQLDMTVALLKTTA